MARNRTAANTRRNLIWMPRHGTTQILCKRQPRMGNFRGKFDMSYACMANFTFIAEDFHPHFNRRGLSRLCMFVALGERVFHFGNSFHYMHACFQPWHACSWVLWHASSWWQSGADAGMVFSGEGSCWRRIRLLLQERQHWPCALCPDNRGSLGFFVSFLQAYWVASPSRARVSWANVGAATMCIHRGTWCVAIGAPCRCNAAQHSHRQRRLRKNWVKQR